MSRTSGPDTPDGEPDGDPEFSGRRISRQRSSRRGRRDRSQSDASNAEASQADLEAANRSTLNQSAGTAGTEASEVTDGSHPEVPSRRGRRKGHKGPKIEEGKSSTNQDSTRTRARHRNERSQRGDGREENYDDDIDYGLSKEGRYRFFKKHLSWVQEATQLNYFDVEDMIKDKDRVNEAVDVKDLPKALEVDWDDGTGFIGTGYSGGDSHRVHQRLFETLRDLNGDDQDYQDQDAPLLGKRDDGREASLTEILLLEKGTTGQFIRKTAEQIQEMRSGAAKASYEEKKRRHQSAAQLRKNYEGNMVLVTRLLKVFWLLVQGLLAGFSGSTVFIVQTAATDTDFIQQYAAVANEIRRGMYLLCTLALLGALDVYYTASNVTLKSKAPSGFCGMCESRSRMVEQSSRILSLPDDHRRAWASRTLPEKSVLTFGLRPVYLLVYITTLLCGVGDITFFHRQNKSSNDDWVTGALEDEEFSFKLTTWKVCNLLRFAGAMLGWLMVCYLTYKDAVFTVLVLDKKRATELELAEASKRCQQYEGDTTSLAEMGRDELHKLLRQQRSALEITERTLDSVNENLALKNTSAGPLPTPVPGQGLTLQLPPLTQTGGKAIETGP